ncbi:MAG: ParB/RepB/Spo0J family partition protein [Chloroflexi bacterium]|nr:ParB/RepB/Spo0J family partition protein [Chloroflexota bacterium]
MLNRAATIEETLIPPSSAPRRNNSLLGRLSNGRSGALGRGLDALLGNLRPSPQPRPEPVPEPVEEASAKKMQVRGRGALLERIQPVAAVVAAPEPVVASAPVRGADYGRGFTQLMQAGAALNAYMPAASMDIDENRVILVEVERLEPNPYLGEAPPDPQALRGLAQAVRLQGMWQPLVVRPTGAIGPDGGPRYWIITGEMRWRAAQMIGQREVPVLVKDVSPRAALQMLLAEQAHISRISPMAQARVYGALTGQMGMSAGEVAERVGQPVSDVLAALQVLNADPNVQEALDRGEITLRAAAALMQAPNPEMRRELLRYASRYNWDADRIEKAVTVRKPE